MWSEVERLRSSVCQELQILCVVLNFSFPLCVHSTQNCCFEFSKCSATQHDKCTNNQQIFYHKKCTEKFRMNCCPMLNINEHSAWYQNVWILAVTGIFPFEYILVCCTLNTPVQSTKSVCEFETQIFLCWRLIYALILIIFLL